ncbi:MAG: cyclase family protein [Actinomycetota bacterium]|nr:cyclase family protein [Actinomycetota bacterium]
MTEAKPGTYDRNGARSPQWWPSRYGVDDQAGAANELTPERTLEALKIPQQGRAIELALTLEPGIPAFPPRMWTQHILAHGTQEATMFGAGHSDTTYYEEQVSQTYHIGCHLDGLAHVGINGRYYNGNHYKDFYSPTEVTKLGIENARPWICRGVVLDIAGLAGEEMLEGGFNITPDHLESACERQGVEVQAGDAVLLHTGWAALWMEDNERFEAQEPGLGWDGAHWLTDRRVSVLGADNWALEVIPFEDPNGIFVVHQHLLSETGTYIIENIKTTELVESGRSEFLFVMTPLKIKGATGCPVSPVCVI